MKVSHWKRNYCCSPSIPRTADISRYHANPSPINNEKTHQQISHAEQLLDTPQGTHYHGQQTDREYFNKTLADDLWKQVNRTVSLVKEYLSLPNTQFISAEEIERLEEQMLRVFNEERDEGERRRNGGETEAS